MDLFKFKYSYKQLKNAFILLTGTFVILFYGCGIKCYRYWGIKHNKNEYQTSNMEKASINGSENSCFIILPIPFFVIACYNEFPYYLHFTYKLNNFKMDTFEGCMIEIKINDTSYILKDVDSYLSCSGSVHKTCDSINKKYRDEIHNIYSKFKNTDELEKKIGEKRKEYQEKYKKYCETCHYDLIPGKYEPCYFKEGSISMHSKIEKCGPLGQKLHYESKGRKDKLTINIQLKFKVDNRDTIIYIKDIQMKQRRKCYFDWFYI